MTSLDPAILMDKVRSAASDILQRDVTELSGFSQSQLALLAQQAQAISDMQLAGVFDGNDELRDHFTQQLETMSRNFVRVLRGIAAVTAEKLVNAIVATLWSAIGSATGMVLPLPGRPPAA